MEDEFFARSANQDGKKEPLEHHSLRSGTLCARFAGAFSCEKIGWLLGVYHDLGKASPLFQRVLEGRMIHVDHAGPGAAAVFAALGGDRSPQAMLVATVIAAHHGRLDGGMISYLRDICRGLPDLYSPNGDTPSLTGAAELQAAMEWTVQRVRPDLMGLYLPNWTHGEDANLNYMLLARMLLSALADADYSASAEHFDPDYLAVHTGPPFDPADALARLTALRAEKQADSKASASLNAIRDKLFDDCLAAAEQTPGIFTLTAPTGTGKTLSLFAFAARHAQAHGKRRIVLVLPFLALAEQNTEDYRRLVPDLLESHSAARLDDRARLLSERWAAPVVVTTTVGFFEPLFASRATDCRRLHQIADSVIVLDEAQSLPEDLLDATLRCVGELCAHYGCTVVFSTATQPAWQYRPHLSWQPKEIVHDPQSLFSVTRRVRYQWRVDQPANLSGLGAELAGQPQVCAIVNLRRHARKLYREVAARCPEDEVFYLTTDLCLAHRRAVLEQIRRRLDKGLPCRLISTQCIEAGVDVSFPVLYRALAPLEAIIQAAGRCNRGGDGPDGLVVVFVPGETGALYPDTHYENAANCVVEMLSDGPIDCSDLSQINDYYRRLYRKHPEDKAALRDAIAARDFAAAERAYKLMGEGSVNVIVPYGPQLALFKTLQAQADRDGLTRSLMKAARPLVVSSYRRKEVQSLCTPIPLRLPRGECAEQTGWYFLGNPSLYDSHTGFAPEAAEFVGIF